MKYVPWVMTWFLGCIALTPAVGADFYDANFYDDGLPALSRLVPLPGRWIPLAADRIAFPANDTLVSHTVVLKGEVQARRFRLVVEPRRARISSVTADDELLRDPEDAAGTVFPTASGDIENFSRELRVTFTRSPTESDETVLLSIYYQD